MNMGKRLLLFSRSLLHSLSLYNNPWWSCVTFIPLCCYRGLGRKMIYVCASHKSIQTCFSALWDLGGTYWPVRIMDSQEVSFGRNRFSSTSYKELVSVLLGSSLPTSKGWKLIFIVRGTTEVLGEAPRNAPKWLLNSWSCCWLIVYH